MRGFEKVGFESVERECILKTSGDYVNVCARLGVTIQEFFNDDLLKEII